MKAIHEKQQKFQDEKNQWNLHQARYNPMSSFAHFNSRGSVDTKTTCRCLSLGCNDPTEDISAATYRAWVFRARAWYVTSHLPTEQHNAELLAAIRGKRAQALAPTLPFDVTLTTDRARLIGGMLHASFGVDGCEGLINAVKDLIHGGKGHNGLLSYAMRAKETIRKGFWFAHTCACSLYLF